ncbi:PIN domain-containing protein [Nocardia sp. AG03]|uniref:PIN domain-containing protein n=1 Tax=Nocardia sp. AG03 TaxID=3025312 RepID=UPI002418B4B0|nr:PIN domain-containing protein [Nocardia sp. AG03]
MFAVLLDTCVLWPSLQRDFLLSLAVEGLYRPLWSERILLELELSECAKLVARGEDDMTGASRARRLVTTLESRFDDALVLNWEPHEGVFGLPDPDDEHVVAAAVVGGADAIVTQNLRDFPADRLPDGLSVRTAAEFAADTVAVSPETAMYALRMMLSRYRNPIVAEEDAMKILVSRYGMDDAVDLLRSAS